MKVNVSSLSELEFCPRSVYLRHVLELKPKLTPPLVRGLVGHAVRKELSLRQVRILKKAAGDSGLLSLVEEEFSRIAAEVPLIYREKLGGVAVEQVLHEIRCEIESEMKMLCSTLEALVEEHGVVSAVKLLTPWKVEYPLKSDAVGFSGVVDKVMPPLVPVEIKTGRVGEGVWEGDRLQLCAYGMLLEGEFGVEVPYGFVEYTRVQEQRPVLFTERLRRRVLEARECVVDILSGYVPEVCPHGSGRKCGSCGFSDVCYTI